MIDVWYWWITGMRLRHGPDGARQTRLWLLISTGAFIGVFGGLGAPPGSSLVVVSLLARHQHHGRWVITQLKRVRYPPHKMDRFLVRNHGY